MRILTAVETSEHLAAGQPPLLIHVLPPGHFAARRISGAVNACVYEMTFMDQVRALAEDPARSVIVYGEGAPSLDSAEAAEKLAAAGFTDVADFRGGLSEWETTGFPIEGDQSLPADPLLDGVFLLDTTTSLIRWTGRNLFNHHEGILRFSGGSLLLRQGALVEGSLEIDMNTIACSDLKDDAMNALLIQHLRHTDFFDVEHYPAASVTIGRATAIPNASAGLPNYEFTARLTLRGTERELVFPAVVAAADADHVTAQAQMEFDRTEFGSRYGSGRFFAFLGQHVVNDLIQLHLKIHAVRSDA